MERLLLSEADSNYLIASGLMAHTCLHQY